jgi:hypothetical protein
MKHILILILLLFGTITYASIEIGSGYSSSHSGRSIPTLALAYSDNSFALSGYSTGVQNDYYYHSAYGLHAFSLKSLGSFLGGNMVGGAGFGAMYSKRGFKDSNDTSESNSDDYVLGPAFRINWSITSFIFINVDVTYGVRELFSHLTLNFQDVVSTSIGFRLW